MNVNKSYTGKTSNIVEKIAKDFDTKVDIVSSDIQETKANGKFQPNSDGRYVLQRTGVTSNGYPYYLFSNLVDLNLQFVDLQTAMTNKDDERSRRRTQSTRTMNLRWVQRLVRRRRVIMIHRVS